MSRRWIFDLDGTLIETRVANLEAYRAVGVEPPEDFAVRPWQEWCSHARHEAKNDELPKMLARYGYFLPAFKVLQALGGYILTNASPRTFAAIVAVFPSIGQYGATIDTPPSRKLMWLLDEQEGLIHPGVYVDDNSALVERVRSMTRWQALDTSGF